jgi:hypothetical protein
LDKDNGGTISIPEFKHFCYNIKALCWKAERVRLEAAGEVVTLGEGTPAASGEQSTKHDHQMTAYASSAKEELMAKSLKRVHDTVKLFWRTQEKLELALFTAPPSYLIIAAYEETKDYNHDLMFIDLTKVKISQEVLVEEAKARQASRPDEAAKPFDDVLDTVRHEYLANWVLQRLTLEGEGPKVLGLKRLFGDDYEGEATMSDPGIGKHVPRAEAKEKVSVERFLDDVEDVKKQSLELRASSTAARRVSQQLTLAIDVFRSIGQDAKSTKGTKGTARNKYVAAFLRWLRKQQVKEMQDMLDSSEFYQDLLRQAAQNVE